MSDKSNASGGGIGFTRLLTVLFVALKLTHQIDWPWLWVVSPIWIALVAVIAILLIGLLVIFVRAALSGGKE